MDDYMPKKRAWCIAGIESGIPYTIVSHGAFAEWMITNSNNQFVHHAEGIVDHAGSPDVEGWVTTTCRDTARLTVDAVLDPAMANRRISIAASRMSATGIAKAFTKATGRQYTTRQPEFESKEDSKLTKKNSTIISCQIGLVDLSMLDFRSHILWIHKRFMVGLLKASKMLRLALSHSAYLYAEEAPHAPALADSHWSIAHASTWNSDYTSNLGPASGKD
eukprot:gene24872-26812_t